MVRLLVCLSLVTGTLLASTAEAGKSKGLKALPAPEEVVFDGVPEEFDGDWRELTYEVKGSEEKGDNGARATVVYDDKAIYVAADVTDDKLVGGGDCVELLLGIPGGTLLSLRLYPGEPGKTKAEVREGERGKVSGAKIVEAPSPGGYTLEASIPWKAVPKSQQIRVGYRGALFVHDADSGKKVDTILGSADTRAYAKLPPMSTKPELELGGGLLRERNITSPPLYNLLADVVGDGLYERVLVYDRFLVVLGPGYRGGDQYYYRDLGTSDVPLFQLSDVTGDGRDDAIVRRRISGERGGVEVLEVLSYHDGSETPSPIFAQEVRVELDSGGVIANEVNIRGSGTGTQIVIASGDATGVEAGGFERDSTTGAAPVLLPWGSIASQTFTVKDGAFVLASEKTRAGAPDEPTVAHSDDPSPSPSPRPRPDKPSPRGVVYVKNGSAADVERVYALYKKKKNVEGDPRWDYQIDLVGDDQAERLVVHDRDVVVFGPGFRDGRGFAALTLASFAEAEDIKSVTTRDINRDGRHEIVVKGEIRTPLPSDLGDGDIHRDVIFVYMVKGEVIERVFAAEIGRRVGDKRVEGKIVFLKKGKNHIELKPGRAVGYSEDDYPWKQKSEPSDGVEPLLLPWGGIERVRLHYDGDKFSR